MSGSGTAPVLRGVRVLDRTTGIAGPYCSKVLVDAGADVVKVEPPGGDPLRSWRSGALFDFLNASKRSVVDEGDLARRCHILLSDQPAAADELPGLQRDNPAVVLVTVTPFGATGPFTDMPWTEFTLQALCGSTASRGLPTQPPLAAGGRIGEWVAGTYAAVAALALWREAGRSGRGDHADVAILDCMAVTMVSYPSVFGSFSGSPPPAGSGRSIQVPSIEPTSDGFFVVTTNSAQQFQDFLVMIGRPDLIDDADLARAPQRFARRDEFLAAVHAHTGERTTAQVLDEAALLRIPAAPVLDGSAIPAFEHFAARGVFVPSPSGRGVQPRVPYRIEGVPPVPFGPAPAVGQHDGAVDWPGTPAGNPGHRQRAGRSSAGPADDDWRLPLADLRVVDCTAWWAGPAATAALAALGADVIKVESAARPDQMRFTSVRGPGQDRWWEWGPLFHGVNVGKRDVTLDLATDEGLDVFRRLLVTADVMVENYTPRVMEQFGLGWEAVHRINPRLVMVRMPAFGLDGPWRDRTGFAQTMEALSGMAWVTGFPDGPPVLVLGACDPIAGMHAVVATLLAVEARDRTGEGRLVEAAMVEAALNVAAEQVVEHSSTGTLLRRDGNRGPSAAPQGVYPCAGEDRWVAIAVETDEQWQGLRLAMGDPDWARDATLARRPGRRCHHDDVDRHLSAWTARHAPEEVAHRLRARGVPAGAVVPARDAVHGAPLAARSLVEEERHPVTGSHGIPMLPFRLTRVARWLRRPSPTLGQHTDEVLAELGVGPDRRAVLRAAGVTGDTISTGGGPPPRPAADDGARPAPTRR